MKIFYSSNSGKGYIDNILIYSKPIFSFEYEYLNVDDNISEYCLKEAVTYLGTKDITESDITDEYLNKPMSEEQKEEVITYYRNFVRDGDIPMYDKNLEKVVESGTELRDGLTYKKYEIVPLTEEELESKYKASIPKSITIRQAREQLIRDGLFATATIAINSIEDATEKAITQNYWEYSERFERNHPSLIALGTVIGLTEVQLDAMFIEAAKL